MDCAEIDFSTLEPADIFGLIATCGPSVITAWRRAIEMDPNAAPAITPEVQAELLRIQEEAATERQRIAAARFIVPAAVVGLALILRRT